MFLDGNKKTRPWSVGFSTGYPGWSVWLLSLSSGNPGGRRTGHPASPVRAGLADPGRSDLVCFGHPASPVRPVLSVPGWSLCPVVPGPGLPVLPGPLDGPPRPIRSS